MWDCVTCLFLSRKTLDPDNNKKKKVKFAVKTA